MVRKVQNLVVDTNAFINTVQIQELADNVYTVREVVEEVKCKRQLRNLIVLPYDLQIKDVDEDCLSFVTKFAKKTGDYLSLSAVDLKVIALTYQLEKEHVGIDHLRKVPFIKKCINKPLANMLATNNQPGFYSPPSDSLDSTSTEWEEVDLTHSPTIETVDTENKDDGCNLQEVPDIDFDSTVLNKFCKLTCEESHQDRKADTNEKSEDSGLSEEENTELNPDQSDSDDIGWVSPAVSTAKGICDTNSEAEEQATVACYSTDFTVQNVLKQIGLNVMSKEGLIIKYLKTYVLRCYACFHVTPQTGRLFCPKCGNKTLKRVSLTVAPDGTHYIAINFRRTLTARGKKYPLPRPRGGKHAVNPILCEDQRVPQQRLSKLALTKNNPMDPDYIAGTSPFVMRDVSSRSATLNAITKHEVKYWMRKNPNEVNKRRRKK